MKIQKDTTIAYFGLILAISSITSFGTTEFCSQQVRNQPTYYSSDSSQENSKDNPNFSNKSINSVTESDQLNPRELTLKDLKDSQTKNNYKMAFKVSTILAGLDIAYIAYVLTLFYSNTNSNSKLNQKQK